MKNILVDLSGEISETSVSILREIEKVSTRLDIPFFVVGATARDILLEHQFDIKPGRATIDIDIGVLVAGWDQFETRAQNRFERHPKRFLSKRIV